MSTATLLDEVASAQENLKNKQDEARDAGTELSRKIAALGASIRQGDSTGDPIRDYAIVAYYGDLDGVATAYYRALNEKFNDAQSALAIAIYTEKVPGRRVMVPTPGFLNTDYDAMYFRFTILTKAGLQFSVNPPYCALPSIQHVVETSLRQQLLLRQGAIMERDPTESLHFHPRGIFELKETAFGEASLRVPDQLLELCGRKVQSILVGDAVVEWLDFERDKTILARAIELMGTLPLAS